MLRLITDKQREDLINYLMSIPSGHHPAGVPFNLVQSLRNLPEPKGSPVDGPVEAPIPPRQ